MPATATARWVRFRHAGATGIGTLQPDGHVLVHDGRLFEQPRATSQRLPLPALELLAPVQPGKIVALWNNFGALATKLGLQRPGEPLYLLKAPGTLADPQATVAWPPGVAKVAFEGELALVIGRRCSRAQPAEALAAVFGATCANDLTAADVLHRDASFPQWARAKGFDGFCPLGPAIATGLDWASLHVRTRVDGVLRQDYPLSDMHFPVAELVSRLSHDMTLLPGDVILCGTSVGVGSMRPGSRVEVEIDGIGCLVNHLGDASPTRLPPAGLPS